MDTVKRRLSRSAHSSQASSRSSSAHSLDMEGLFEVPQSKDIPLNTNMIENIEENIPADVMDVPNYYKSYTMNHPLGNLILRMASINTELCKKLNVQSQDSPDLAEVCSKFTEFVKLERNKTASKISKVTDNIESSILGKELNFHAVNASVQPPDTFSPIPVLITSAKMQEAMKTFPAKTSQKFSGTSSGVNILEFLHAMNSAQGIMNLSRSEFLQMLQKCVSGKVYTLIAECITYGNDVGDVYHSLLTLYDNRISSATARKMLMTYKATKTQSLMKVQSIIMEYSSRIASDLPKGDSRTHMFNIEANSGLVRCLPHTSATLVTNVINSLAARLQRNPTFVEVIKSLHKYAEAINNDIARNGVLHNKLYNNPDTAEKLGRYRIYSIDRRNDRRDRSRNNRRNFKQVRNTGRKFLNIRGINMEKHRDSARHESSYNMSNNFNRNRMPNQNSKPYFKGRYCSLCGSKSHTADQICFRMRDSSNRIVETVPTYFPCEICIKKLNKKLYHPESMCFSKDSSPQSNINTLKSD